MSNYLCTKISRDVFSATFSLLSLCVGLSQQKCSSGNEDIMRYRHSCVQFFLYVFIISLPKNVCILYILDKENLEFKNLELSSGKICDTILHHFSAISSSPKLCLFLYRPSPLPTTPLYCYFSASHL